MVENEALLIIKPLSIARGDGPSILADCLNKTDLALIRFREWAPCNTTVKALGEQAENEIFPPMNRGRVWICLFTSLVDTHAVLTSLWQDASPLSVRRKYLQNVHCSDNLIRITSSDRLLFETDLLF